MWISSAGRGQVRWARARPLEGIIHAARYRRILMSWRVGHRDRTLSSIWTCP